MTDSATDSTGDDAPQRKRYRLPGIEREGIGQLSILETALWPLQGGPLQTPTFETTYEYTMPGGKDRKKATVTVRASLGLQPTDEFILWGLLGATLSKPDADPVLLATPYWMFKHLGLVPGGRQYNELRASLLRLSATSYQNTAFYNPETQEREYVGLQFLSMLLPTVGGRGETVDVNRCWRIEWNPAFFRFCKATGGNLLFDLDLYRELTPTSRRLFLKLKDRFWRTNRVFLNVDDLTINGLGLSASRPLKNRKYKLTQSIEELLSHGIIELGRGQSDPKDLFLKRGKGSYVVCFYEGEYFRHPLSARSVRQKNAISEDPLYEPLTKIGVDAAAIRRIFAEHSRGMIKKWVRITDAAMHEKPRGFSGFRVSPAAFLIDGLQQNRLPPEWIYAHDKRLKQEQWERERASFAATEQQLLQRYDIERGAAFEAFLVSPDGRAIYEKTYATFLDFYKHTEPNRSMEAAHEATIARMEKLDFHYPEYGIWILQARHDPSGRAA